MNKLTQGMKYIFGVAFFSLIVLAGSSLTTFAQNHSRGAERHIIRDQQRYENHQWRSNQRIQPQTNNGYYRNRSYSDTYYNNYPAYGNNGYYNNGYSNNGYYDRRYSRPHIDSRNPVKRGLHHLFGGH